MRPLRGMPVFVLAKVLFRGHADFLLKLLAQVWPHVANGSVHRVIRGAGVDAPPGDADVQHPLGELSCPSGVHAKVADEILLRHARIIAVETRVDDENVTFLDFYLACDVFRFDDVPVVHISGDVHDHTFMNQFR